jgi:hypothetical protein
MSAPSNLRTVGGSFWLWALVTRMAKGSCGWGLSAFWRHALMRPSWASVHLMQRQERRCGCTQKWWRTWT